MNFQKATAVILSALIACFLSGCDMPIEFAVSSKSQSNSALSNSNNDCLILRPNLGDYIFSNRKSPNFANIRSFLLFLCKLCVKIIDSSLFSN